MKIIQLVFLGLLANHALAKEFFYAAHISDKKVVAIVFNCETKSGELLCNTRETSIGYYTWKKDDKEFEPNRCRISVWEGKQTFLMKSIGVWTRRERGFCGALIEYVIRPAPYGQIDYEEITLENDDNHDSLCWNAFGKPGTIKRYQRHDVLSRIPFPCSSIVVFP